MNYVPPKPTGLLVIVKPGGTNTEIYIDGQKIENLVGVKLGTLAANTPVELTLIFARGGVDLFLRGGVDALKARYDDQPDDDGASVEPVGHPGQSVIERIDAWLRRKL